MHRLFFPLALFFFLSGAAPRYVSLAPSTTEILFALGLDGEIAGVSSYCDYPPSAAGKPKIGDFSHPSMETIVSLKPDFVFATGLEQAPAIEELRRLGMKVYVADPADFSGLFSTISDIGRITGRTQEARRLIKAMKKDIAAVRARASSVPRGKKVRVFLEIWRDPLMTAGRGSFVDEMISLAGGVNVAGDVPRPYCNYSAEKVVSADPDCVIMAYMDKEPPVKLAEKRPGWAGLSAVRNGRVYNDIDPDLLLRPGPRLTAGLKALQDKLYP
ncbi:MAG TPA: cobalamin-binding protein [Elusimicrobiales bacterium]|nr:cobalamin-binding protein [Elusimicrobiales bacterium]